jgi:hypothetical protein
LPIPIRSRRRKRGRRFGGWEEELIIEAGEIAVISRDPGREITSIPAIAVSTAGGAIWGGF